MCMFAVHGVWGRAGSTAGTHYRSCWTACQPRAPRAVQLVGQPFPEPRLKTVLLMQMKEPFEKQVPLMDKLIIIFLGPCNYVTKMFYGIYRATPKYFDLGRWG